MSRPILFKSRNINNSHVQSQQLISHENSIFNPNLTLPSVDLNFNNKNTFYDNDEEHTLAHGRQSKIKLTYNKHDSKQAYVVKIVNIEGTSDNGSGKQLNILEMAENEIFILRQLNHPNIIKFYENFKDKNFIYILMEHAQFGNIYDFLSTNQRSKLNEEEAFRVFFQLCLAVDYIHLKNIVHGEIKPDNILIDKYFNTKLCDFGSSFKKTQYTPQDHLFRLALDSQEYIAPEILFQQKVIEKKSDIWSLGVTLYELVHGRLPFKGQTPIETQENIKKGNLLYDINLSNELKDLIEGILSVNPKERPTIEQIFSHQWVYNNIGKYQSFYLFHSDLKYNRKSLDNLLRMIYPKYTNNQIYIKQLPNKETSLNKYQMLQLKEDNIHNNIDTKQFDQYLMNNQFFFSPEKQKGSNQLEGTVYSPSNQFSSTKDLNFKLEQKLNLLQSHNGSSQNLINSNVGQTLKSQGQQRKRIFDKIDNKRPQIDDIQSVVVEEQVSMGPRNTFTQGKRKITNSEQNLLMIPCNTEPGNKKQPQYNLDILDDYFQNEQQNKHQNNNSRSKLPVFDNSLNSHNIHPKNKNSNGQILNNYSIGSIKTIRSNKPQNEERQSMHFNSFKQQSGAQDQYQLYHEGDNTRNMLNNYDNFLRNDLNNSGLNPNHTKQHLNDTLKQKSPDTINHSIFQNQPEHKNIMGSNLNPLFDDKITNLDDFLSDPLDFRQSQHQSNYPISNKGSVKSLNPENQQNLKLQQLNEKGYTVFIQQNQPNKENNLMTKESYSPSNNQYYNNDYRPSNNPTNYFSRNSDYPNNYRNLSTYHDQSLANAQQGEEQNFGQVANVNESMLYQGGGGLYNPRQTAIERITQKYSVPQDRVSNTYQYNNPNKYNGDYQFNKDYYQRW